MGKRTIADLLFLATIYGMGPCVVGSAVGWASHTALTVLGSDSATGVVTYATPPNDEFFGRAVVKFATEDGKHLSQTFSTSSGYAKGEEVLLAFPPRHPEVARINNVPELYSETFWFGMFGLLMSLPWFIPFMVQFGGEWEEAGVHHKLGSFGTLNFNHADHGPLVDFFGEKTMDYQSMLSSGVKVKVRYTTPDGKVHETSNLDELPEEMREQLTDLFN